MVVTGTITDASGFTNCGFEKNGAGTLYLQGTNTWTGYTKTSGGFIEFNSDVNLGLSSSPGPDPGALRAAKLELLIGGGIMLAPGLGTVSINRYIPIQNAGSQTAIIDVESGSTLNLSGTLVSGTNGQTLFYQGAGNLTFFANAGPFIGNFTVGNGAATGTATIASIANLFHKLIIAIAIDRSVSSLSENWPRASLNTSSGACDPAILVKASAHASAARSRSE